MTLLTIFASSPSIPVEVIDTPTPVPNVIATNFYSAFGGGQLDSRAGGFGLPIAVVGDSIVNGAPLIFSPQFALRLNGRPIAVTGSLGLRHEDGQHDSGRYIAIGTSNITVNGLRAVRTGDPTTCGHTVIALNTSITG